MPTGFRLADTPSGRMTACNLSVRAVVAGFAVLAAFALAATLPNAAFGADSTLETSSTAGAERFPRGTWPTVRGMRLTRLGLRHGQSRRMRQAMRQTARETRLTRLGMRLTVRGVRQMVLGTRLMRLGQGQTGREIGMRRSMRLAGREIRPMRRAVRTRCAGRRRQGRSGNLGVAGGRRIRLRRAEGRR